MPDAGQRVRWTVLFAGRVQGVGFRFTTRRVAQDFKVDGAVRNLPDGRVEMVAEGTPAELKAFVAGIEQAMGGCVRDRQVSEAPASGTLTGFQITF